MIGVIFDFNGTLFVDEDKQRASWQAFARTIIHHDLSAEEFAKYVFGRNTQETLNYIFGRQLDPQEVSYYGEQKEASYRRLCSEDGKNFHLRPGAESYFERLSNANVPHIIATASGEKNVDFFFDAFGLDRWFDATLTVYNDGKLKSKPDPQAFTEAMVRLNVLPEHALVFEDSDSGIQAAHNSRAKYIIAMTGTIGESQWRQRYPYLAGALSDYNGPSRYLNTNWLAAPTNE
ncbi:HAD family phosphatase (plasmid) [Lacticaseibacillus paracasei]|uniref:HAD family hydrolase n=1 Tax=Lacticaseibacillus paracasei TaxID=1597 RepID=UPI00222EC67A|nr:HAD family phosphatase [Lacticaseibacillus paracasei]UZD27683.1 HAD family phosphatase [Lacticaseibacillus paracasei]